MANYSSAIINLFFWIILIGIFVYIFLKILKYIYSLVFNLEEEEEEVFFEPEPVVENEVQMVNIAGQEVIINDFI